MAGWVHCKLRELESSWSVDPCAVAWRMSVPPCVPVYANVTVPSVFVTAVATVGLAPATVSVDAKFAIGRAQAVGQPATMLSDVPVSSGPGAVSAMARFAPTIDGSGSTVTVARSAVVRIAVGASSCKT